VVREDSPEVLREACPPDLTSVDEKDVVVWVDPLDGTGEFTKGFYEDVTVLVGIAVEGKPVAGVIHQPFYGTTAGLPTAQQGRTVWGMLGLGVRGIVPRPSPEHGGLRLAVSRSHYSGTVERVTECLQAKEKVGSNPHYHLGPLLATHTVKCTKNWHERVCRDVVKTAT
jgi:3'(2'), 5'-bisphosphate nucleotidase